MQEAQFSRWFGFTEEEVRALCAEVPDADIDGIREWYDGYRVGDQVVYNPWSVLRYLTNVEDGFLSYWVNTASDDLLRSLLVDGGMGVHDDLAQLMRGGQIDAPISESIHLRDLPRDVTTLWSFLLFSGYLNAVVVRREDGATLATLAIPNREVRATYREMFLAWLDVGAGSRSAAKGLVEALLAGDADTFGGLLNRLMLESLSFLDAHRRTPEAVYQAFLVGLFVHLDGTHVVDSNRESGFGRYDVCVRPRRAGQPGAVLELKSYDPDRSLSPEQVLDAAIAQVRTRAYSTALRQAGAAPVWEWAAVFDGKRVHVRREPA